MIQLGFPWALLALASIPAILILHTLRPTRRSIRVSSTSLWREALREQQRGFGLQKLRQDPSLLLLLLFALVAALGLASPQWVTRAAEPGDVVVVLDVSASMKAKTDAESRFSRAKRRVADFIDELPRGGRMLIMTSGRNAVVRSAFETEAPALHRALDRLAATDETGRPRAALSLALSLLRNRANGRIYFATDGAFEPHESLERPHIEFLDVGGPGRNVAITRFDLRREVGSEDRFQLLLAARNYTANEVSAPVIVTIDERQVVERRLRLPPGGKKSLVLPLRGRAVGVARAEIAYDDDLAADNQAFAVMTEADLSVLLFTKGNFYLESVFRALPNVFFTRMNEVWTERFREQAARHDLVVFDRIEAPSLPPGNYLLIDSVPPDLPFAAIGTVAYPAIEGWSASPLMRNLDLHGIKIDSARRVTTTRPSPGMQRLFWSAETDLALALLHDDKRIVYLGFDLSRSNFPLQAAFPLFFGQALDWLRPRGAGRAATQVAAGEPVTISVPREQGTVVVRTPSNRRLRLGTDGGALRFDATSEAGIYAYRRGSEREYFAVNLTDEGESDISPRSGPKSRPTSPPSPAPGTGVAAATAGARTGQVSISLWPYLAALAMFILALEWCLWCRRRGAA